MESNKKNLSFRLLVLITNQKLAGKAVKLFREGAVPLQYKLHGMGTASSDMMDILGLGSIDKDVLVSLLPKDFAVKTAQGVKNWYSGKRNCFYDAAFWHE